LDWNAWNNFFINLDFLDNILEELLIIHKHLILLDTNHETIKSLEKLKFAQVNLKTVKPELKKWKIEVKRMREQGLEVRKKYED
jgi:hypothetical protein